MGLGKSLKKAAGKLGGGLLNVATFGLLGGSKGPANPYGAPDPSFLFNTSKLDYLKDTKPFDFLKDTSRYDFLKSPTPTNSYGANLVQNTKKFSDTYNDNFFNDLLGAIPTGPSSTDQVYSALDNERVQQLLEGIDVDTKKSIGSLKSDFADRGLSGPGMISDIEGNALAQAYGDADKRKAAARTEYMTKELDRIKQREQISDEARRDAYGARYGAGVQGALTDVASQNEALATQAQLEEARLGRDATKELGYADLVRQSLGDYADLISDRDSLFAQLLNQRELGAIGQATNLYNAGADRQIAGKEPSLFDKLLSRVNLNIGVQ